MPYRTQDEITCWTCRFWRQDLPHPGAEDNPNVAVCVGAPPQYNPVNGTHWNPYVPATHPACSLYKAR